MNISSTALHSSASTGTSSSASSTSTTFLVLENILMLHIFAIISLYVNNNCKIYWVFIIITMNFYYNL